jgi:ABC-2 type transport system permease protein
MKEIRLANKIIRTLVKDRMQYPGRLIADTFALVARCGVLLILYWFVFNLKGGAVNGTPYIIVAWSMFFYFAFSTLRLRDISKSIMQDVQSGNVEVLFNKPVSYLGYRIWWQIGSGLYPFLVATILGSIALALIVGIPETMTLSIFLPTVFLVFIGASVLSLILYSIVGLLAFWIEEVNPVFWMVDKAVMILGGSYLPVALFPPFMYKLAIYSPFGASQFVTHTVYERWQSEWLMLVGIQGFWILVLALVVYIMFEKAKKKVSVNGG